MYTTGSTGNNCARTTAAAAIGKCGKKEDLQKDHKELQKSRLRYYEAP